ncbi:MAG: AMP-binding enzyme, partial [Actinopolymorphaceae bacterium]
ATGDVGYLDPDGDLVLVDRLKELITVSGFSVYPREIEDVIVELDSVAEAAVVGMPDSHTGEAVKAYVVPRMGRQVSSEEVLSYCDSRLARFKRPSVVAVVDALPRSVTGTVAKARLRLVQADDVRPTTGPAAPASAEPGSGAPGSGPEEAAEG